MPSPLTLLCLVIAFSSVTLCYELAKPLDASASANKILCPDGKHECSDQATCCKTETGDWGCCPLFDAVCCSDHRHCCPRGSTCDLRHHRCLAHKSDPVPWREKVAATKVNDSVNDVQCDAFSSCPDETTCCKLPSGKWGCCPFPNAVCCSDKVHCCPSGTQCDLPHGTCVQREKVVRKLLLVKGTLNDVLCDAFTSCPDGTTCCKTPSGKWGCCPFPKAVCCTDHVHCCPSGTQCDLAHGTCIRSEKVVGNLMAVQSIVNDVQCDAFSSCPDGTTCCKLPSGTWGCCPFPQAICCADHVHCCPSGTQCDLAHGKCVQSKGIPIGDALTARVEIVSSPSMKEHPLKVLVCPDHRCYCRDGATCCQLPSGEYGCCPYPRATCCPDHLHCCPHRAVCDLQSGMCRKDASMTTPMMMKSPALPLSGLQNYERCQDGKTLCSEDGFCCITVVGEWGCCSK